MINSNKDSNSHNNKKPTLQKIVALDRDLDLPTIMVIVIITIGRYQAEVMIRIKLLPTKLIPPSISCQLIRTHGICLYLRSFLLLTAKI